jgi:exopolysaccharide biosynthesis polyprenyl glycosylphosphotransferase
MPAEARAADATAREQRRPAPPADTTTGNGRGPTRARNGQAAPDIRCRTPYALAPFNLTALGLAGVRVATLLAVDVAGVAGGVYAALVLRELWLGHTPPWEGLWSTAIDWLGFLWLVTALVFAQAGLYAARQRRPGTARIVSSVVLVGALTLAFALGTGFDFNTYGIVPTSIVIAAVLIVALRQLHDRVAVALHARGRPRRAAVVGTGATLEHLQRELAGAGAGSRWTIVEAVDPAASTSESNGLGDLRVLLARDRLDELIVAEPGLDEARLLEAIDLAHRHGVTVLVAPTATRLLGRPAEILPGHSIPLIELRPPVFAGADWLLKRSFDIVVSILVILVGLPLWLTISIVVKSTSTGPILYRDRRVGLNEREFDMLKFRTMRADAPEKRLELFTENEADGVLFKIRRDPRVTRPGRVLRRFSLDEVPQVLNVLRGEMTLVGPRPLPAVDYMKLEQWQRQRSLVLPGITGLWQISGRSDLGTDELIALDFHYLERWSLWLDVVILAKTVPAVIVGRGAY